MNGATCVRGQVNSFSFTCQCPYGYSGELCEKSSVGFHQGSSILLPSVLNSAINEGFYTNEDTNELVIEIAFATLQKNCLLLIEYSPTIGIEEQNSSQRIRTGQFFLQLEDGFPSLSVAGDVNGGSLEGEETVIQLRNNVECSDAAFHVITIRMSNSVSVFPYMALIGISCTKMLTFFSLRYV